VYAEVDRVPTGSVTTYGDIARAVGAPGGSRAVARALAMNPCPKRARCQDDDGAPVVNCHRVVSAHGKVTGYLGETTHEAIQARVEMLREEGVPVSDEGVVAPEVVTG
jgi:methylated-DNA-[protein]-cysteine S-methyltransferase